MQRIFNYYFIKMLDQTKKVVEDKKSEQELMQEFVQEYQRLCERFGLQIVVNPAFKARDDGTFSVVLQTSAGRMPKESI
jgi:hypothetical protein